MTQKIKRHFLRTFGFAVMLLMVISSVVPGMISRIPLAQAAAGQGTALISTGTSGANAGATTFGTPAATGTVTVGTKTYVKIDLAVGTGGILANQNNVTIQINDNLFPASSWGTSMQVATSDLDTVGKWTVAYTDNGGATSNVGIAFTASASATGLITIQANQIMDALDVIHIYGVVQDDHNLLVPADVVIQTSDSALNPLVTIATPPQIATTAADAAATVTKTNPTAGSTGNLTLAFTVPRTLIATDKINITFPASYALANTVATILTANTCSGDGGTLAVTTSSQTLILTVGGGTMPTSMLGCSVTIPGVDAIPKYFDPTDLSAFTVQTSGSTNIATDVTLTDSLTNTTAGPLISTNVEPASLIVLTKGTATVTFETADAETILNTDKIEVTFPAGYDVSGASGGTCPTMNSDTYATSISGQSVTITRDGTGTTEPIGVQTCTIANIWTPNTIGATGVYQIVVTNSVGTNKYQNLEVAADTITGGSQNSGGGGGGAAVDTTPPTDTSVAIVGAPKVPTANVQLTLAATGATEMMISNVADFTGATWETYNTVKNWTLTNGLGAKIVYVEFRDAAHNVSAAVQANVTVEANAPAPTPVPVPVAESPMAGVPFLDIATHWAKDFIAQLSKMGVVQGCTPTSYCPDVFLTRAEMVKIALLTFGYQPDNANTKSFSDVDAAMWFAPYLALAKAQSIIGGYNDGTFHPNNPITRVEALKILLAAAKKNVAGAVAAPFSDVNQSAWYAQYVNFAFANKLVSGKDATHFAPADNITRAEMAKIAILSFQLK